MRALILGAALTIVVLSLVPLPEPPIGDFAAADKVGHAAAYLVLGFLLFARQLPGPRARAFLVAVAASVMLGGLLELVQPLVQRNRELWDLLAGSAGAVAGALAGLALAVPLTRLLRRDAVGQDTR